MKKVFLFAVAAAALVACSNEELSLPENNLVNSNEAPVTFDVYTQRAMTRGGIAGTNDNANIGTRGFGVFAYYTIGEGYDAKATPNFMYNQQVKCTDNPVTTASKWTYEPVKYWPNEYGSDAMSDEVDQLSFFAYAPWTEVDPTTGNIVPKDPDPNATTPQESKDHQQKYNIISVNKNTATGDPLVKYVVDTDPATSVDLLWGVAAENAGDNYSPISAEGVAPTVKPGVPFINLVKPNNPANDRLQFNLKHALAKLRVTIDYIDDANTPAGPAAAAINAETTRIFVRSFKMNGLAMKGALNLNNSEGTPGEPSWKDFDGVKDLSFDEVTFQDGRKDGKEGETNGAQNNETPQGLNEKIIENYSPAASGTFGAEKNLGVGAMTADVQPAVTLEGKVAKGTVLLFGGKPDTNDGYFYIIPRNEGTSPVDVTIAYDVETIDPALAGKLSDGETRGISIENIITKENIFGGMDFRAGYVYEIKIHLGMTSVKIDATVTEWKDTGKTNVDLPDNQQPAAVTAINYAYPDNYTYTAPFYASDNDVCYTGALNEGGMNDLARFLGALHRAAGVNKITYDEKDYTWNPTRIKELGIVPATDGDELKGSNWFNEEEGTLVSVITAKAKAGNLSAPLTIKADNDVINIYLGATHNFISYGKEPNGTYIQYATGTVLVTDGKIGSTDYKKALVITNSVDGFVGKTYYIDNNAAVGNTNYYQLRDSFGNLLPIWVQITSEI